MANKQNYKPATIINQERKRKKLLPDFSLSLKLSLLLAFVVCAVYANTMLNGYAYDDSVMIQKNKLVTQGIKAVPRLLVTPHMSGFLAIPNDVYRPLSLVMFAIEYQFFGANAAVGHFFNIITFILCVVLLFIVLDKLFDQKKTVAAFIAALIFAVHPIHTEVVANIKSRDELLCFFFAFLSLYFFMKYMLRGQIKNLLAGAFLLYLSYLSKETVIAFLGIIPFIFFFYFNNSKKRAVLITVASSAVTIVFLIVRIVILNKYKANLPTPTEFIDNALSGAPGVVSYWATVVVMMGKYLKLMFIPYPLLCNYSFNSIHFSGLTDVYFWISLFAYGFMIYYGVKKWIKKRDDLWAFAIIFYLATIFIFSNIPFLIAAQFAERFVFFASVGFCIAVALALDKWIIKNDSTNINSFKNLKLLAILIPLFLVFGSLTAARNADWKSSDVLFANDIEKSPDDSRLHHHLAVSIDVAATEETDSLERRRLENESIMHFRKALEIYPGYRMAMADLANVYSRKQMYDSAEKYFLMTLAIDPVDIVANNNLGSLYYNTSKYDKAIIYFKKAIGLSPEIKFTYLNVANSFKKLGVNDSAIKYDHIALSIDPKYIDAHKALAEAYDLAGNIDSVEFHYKQMSGILPQNADITNDFGIYYFSKKRYNEAIEQFTKTVKLDSNYINAYANMGISFFMTNQYEAAIAAFNKELALDPRNGQDIPYIALAYQKLGKTDLALKYEAIVKQFNPNFKLP